MRLFVPLFKNTQCQIALRLRPDLPEAMDSLGFALAAKRKYSEAIAWYRKSIFKEPNNIQAHEHLADALRQTHANAEAERE